MKTYKHKTLWWIAKLDSRATRYEVHHSEWNFHLVHPSIIENSQDREEIVENDWVDKVLEEFWRYTYYWNTYETRLVLRNAIENHTPKFTEESILEWMRDIYTNSERNVVFNEIRYFLKNNNLLKWKP